MMMTIVGITIMIFVVRIVERKRKREIVIRIPVVIWIIVRICVRIIRIVPIHISFNGTSIPRVIIRWRITTNNNC